MSVRAKFSVKSKTITSSGYKDREGKLVAQTSVKLEPVHGGSEENKRFFSASPSGSIELGILNQFAADQFEIGKEYYIDFTEAIPLAP